MLNIFDLAYFLKETGPYNRKFYSRDHFLDDLFFPLIQDFNIKNIRGQEFDFSLRLTSLLFSGKSDMPITFKKYLKPSIFTDERYIKNGKKAFEKSLGTKSIYNVCASLVETFKNDLKIDKADKDYALKIFSSEKYYDLLWYMLCYVSSLKRTVKNKKTNEKSKPFKRQHNVSYFCLSQKDKEKKKINTIRFLLNENNHLNITHLKLLIEILTHSHVDLSFKEKCDISYNFLKSWESEKGIGDLLSFLMYFDDAKSILPENSKNFEEWNEAAEFAYGRLKFDQVNAIYEKAKETNDFNKLCHFFLLNITSEKCLASNSCFLSSLFRQKFLLPNYNYTIPDSLWRYCMQVARFCSQTQLKDKLILFINENKNANKNDDTIQKRCNILLNILNNSI